MDIIEEKVAARSEKGGGWVGGKGQVGVGGAVGGGWSGEGRRRKGLYGRTSGWGGGGRGGAGGVKNGRGRRGEKCLWD